MSRRLKVLGGLALVLGGLALLGPPDPPRALGITFGLPALFELQRITLRRTGAPEVVLQRAGAGWTADGAPLDAGGLRDLQAVFAQPIGMDKVERVADAELGRYSLTADTLTATFEGTKTQTVRIGKVVDGRRTFIRPEPDGPVYRARANLRRALDRPAQAWRERRLFPGRSLADLRIITVSRQGQPPWQASRPDAQTDWQVAGVPRPAQDVVHGLANTFVGLTASRFGGPTNLSPTLTIEARTEDGQRLGVAIGPRTASGAPAKRIGDGLLVSLPKHQLAFIDVPRQALTERRLFVARPEAIRGVAVAGPTPLRIAREGEVWSMSLPRAVPELPAEAVDAFVAELLTLQAAGVLPSAPPDAFVALHHTVTLHVDGDRQIELNVGAEWQNGARYARISEAPEVVYALAPKTLAALNPAVERLTTPQRP